MKTKFNWPKAGRHSVPKPKPAKAQPAPEARKPVKSETSARARQPAEEPDAQALADQVKQLESQLRTERAEQQGLRWIIQQYEKEESPSMSASISLGDVVLYQPPVHLGTAPCFAFVLAVHDDGAADLRVANGYCAGWSDVERVQPSDDGDPGTFFPKGTQKTKTGQDIRGPLRPPVEIPPSDPWGALGSHGPVSIPFGMLGSPITEAQAKAQKAASGAREEEPVESNA